MKLGHMVLIFVLLSCCVNALLDPVIQTDVAVSSSGLQIEYPKVEAYLTGSNFTLHFHVFNSSGFQYRGAYCFLHLYNPKDIHLQKSPMVLDGLDYSVVVNASVASVPGRYAYVAWCNSTKGAGFVSSSFFLTNSGTEDSTQLGHIFLALLPVFFAFLLLGACFFLVEEHTALIPFMVLASLAFIVLAGYLINRILYLFNATNLSGDLAFSVWIMGIVLTVLLVYFLIWLIKRIFKVQSEKKRERREY